ncbi:uncharacterized membrane protein YsdA (DUF1294 family) [Comamonas sp. BIGb0124]|uniref:cold shock and DUF1294 domain-containing protein n=1 Tax=Comamonas sp. BIGb0124 TaxID=2485130 RepID=UPI000FB3EA65|nr:cold shock and DUF1294 domain-containing protein [Comamonas sp. BIGb0124]ROR22944.1 uncharacterized membrane protein YsdA (DUF1294 family) [Comamonas sp. BIGb0124]
MRPPLRHHGKLISWNDDRGFGFIRPAQGGTDVFVHIQDMDTIGGERPSAGQAVSYEMASGVRGKPRAARVAVAGSRNPASRAGARAAPAQPVRTGQRARQRRGPGVGPRPAGGLPGLTVIPLFMGLYLAVTLMWPVPRAVLLLYLAASALCFLAYAHDKRAARRGAWRTPEKTLLMLGLAGGWPGGLLAQHYLRHKSAKASFQVAFWLTMLLNTAAFVALASPWGEPLTRWVWPLLHGALPAALGG